MQAERSPLCTLQGKNTVIAAGADLVYDYGKRQKWFPWL